MVYRVGVEPTQEDWKSPMLTIKHQRYRQLNRNRIFHHHQMLLHQYQRIYTF